MAAQNDSCHQRKRTQFQQSEGEDGGTFNSSGGGMPDLGVSGSPI
jgi:hypothetical protein